MKKFTYRLDENGVPVAFGYLDFENQLSGLEPFTSFDIVRWRKDIETGEWIYDTSSESDIQEIEI